MSVCESGYKRPGEGARVTDEPSFGRCLLCWGILLALFCSICVYIDHDQRERAPVRKLTLYSETGAVVGEWLYKSLETRENTIVIKTPDGKNKTVYLLTGQAVTSDLDG